MIKKDCSPFKRGATCLPAGPGNTSKSLSVQSLPSGSTQIVRLTLRHG